MAQMEDHFGAPSEGSTVSYDWYDFTTGLGYKNFYCVIERDSGGYEYLLSPNVMDSNAGDLQVTGSFSSGSFVQQFEYNFDATFAIPAIIGGIGHAQLTFELTHTTGSYTEGYIIVNVYHVAVDTTETLIGTNQSVTESKASAGTQGYREVFPITITKKAFSIGEKLRISVEFWGRENTVGTWKFYFDNNNRVTAANDEDGVSPDTDAIISIPFKVDI